MEVRHGVEKTSLHCLGRWGGRESYVGNQRGKRCQQRTNLPYQDATAMLSLLGAADVASSPFPFQHSRLQCVTQPLSNSFSFVHLSPPFGVCKLEAPPPVFRGNLYHRGGEK
jgi:hypothetical protein